MKYEYIVPFSHSQFYIGDDNLDWDPSEVWDERTSELGFAWMPEAIGVGVAREDGYVYVVVETRNSRPNVNLSRWDQAIECSIRVPSGRLQVSSTRASLEPMIATGPGYMRVLVLWGNLTKFRQRLHTASESEYYRLVANCEDSKEILREWDHYRIVMWPDRRQKRAIIKRAPPAPWRK